MAQILGPLFSMQAAVLGVAYQTYQGAVTYSELQEQLAEAYKQYEEWQDRYDELYQSYMTVQFEIDQYVGQLERQIVFLRDQTQIEITEINKKAQTINWLWLVIILIMIFTLIFKRFSTGKLILEVISYPFIFIFTAIVNGFLYIFGLSLYDWPKNPFVEDISKDNDSNEYNFKINNKVYLSPSIAIIGMTIFMVVILIILITTSPKKKNEYFSELYDEPTYSIHKNYSKEQKKNFAEKRKQKKNKFKFDKKIDLTYRWESFSKDLRDDIGDEKWCNNDKCKYTSKGFIAKDNSIWDPPLGINENNSNISKEFKGAPLFNN